MYFLYTQVVMYRIFSNSFCFSADAFAQFEDKMTDVCLEITYVGCAVLVVGYIQVFLIKTVSNCKEIHWFCKM